jgi:hypothetical protein
MRRLLRFQAQVADWGGALLAIVAGTRDIAASLRRKSGAGVRFLADPGGELHRRLGQAVSGQPVQGALVFERGGVLRYRLPPHPSEAEIHEALEWIRYLGIREPECSTCVPAWPAEWLEADTRR